MIISHVNKYAFIQYKTEELQFTVRKAIEQDTVLCYCVNLLLLYLEFLHLYLKADKVEVHNT